MFAKRFLILIFISVFVLFIFPVAAQGNVANLDKAVSWLKENQQADGGFSNGFAAESDLGTTSDVVLALVFAGEDPVQWVKDGKTPIDFMEEHVRTGDVKSAGIAAKIVLALNALNLDPTSFAGQNLIEIMLENYDDATGLFGFGPFDSGLVICALKAVNVELPDGALEGLISTRLKDGSFSFNLDPNLATGDSNTTAIVVQALIAAGLKNEIGPSLNYFRTTQNEDGGWTYQKPSDFGEETDANSTALVIQALNAAGEDLEDWADPMTALASLQLDNGAFSFNSSFPDPNILATIQAIPTLVGGTYAKPTPPFIVSDEFLPSIVIGASILIILVLAGSFIIARRRIKENN